MDRWITDWDVNPRYPLFTRANAGEVLPDPASPLAWTLVWEPGCLQGWRDAAVIGYGTMDPDEFDDAHPEVVGSFGGYLYINGSAVRIFGVRGPGLTPEAVDYIYFGEHPDVPPYVAEPWHENAAATERMGAWMQGVIGATDLPELRDDRDLADLARAERPELSKLTDHDLVARARSFTGAIRALFCRHLTVTAGSSIGPGILGQFSAAMGDPTLVMRLVAGLGDVDSAAPSQALWELSRRIRASAELGAAFDGGVDGVLRLLRGSASDEAKAFLAEWAEFVRRFGSRGPNEWDIRSEVWETKPQLALALAERMRHQADDEAPSVRFAARAADRNALTEQIMAGLEGRPEDQAMFMAGLRSAHTYLQGRERTKTNVIKVIHEVRMAMRELGSRHGYTPSETCMLLADELDAFVSDPSAFRARLTGREEQYLTLFDLEPPFIVNGTPPPLSQWRRRSDAPPVTVAVVGDVLSGVPGCPGEATGRARVVLDPADPLALEPGDVLVAPLTDPAWTPLFVPAAAVVVDVGAQVSHAVIVSRELGIPCVVSVTDATRRIPDGALVRVDGTTGAVHVLEVPA
jgi:phosphohistidine swiveling domain-containing protein